MAKEKSVLSKKISKLKSRVQDLEIKHEDIESTVKKMVRDELNEKSKIIITKKVAIASQQIEKKILSELTSDFFKKIKVWGKSTAEQAIRDRVRWEIKYVEEKEMTVKKLEELYSKGWSIAWSNPTWKIRPSEERKWVMLHRPQPVKKKKIKKSPVN